MGFNPLVVVGVGLATGILSGLMGIGGGIVAVPMLVSFLKLNQHQAHGTSLAMIVITSVYSAAAYTVRGDVDYILAIKLAVGAAVGAYVGARLMNRVPAHRLRQIFGVLMLLVGLRMIF